MSARERRPRALLLALPLLALCACHRTRAPEGFLKPPVDKRGDVHGAWVGCDVRPPFVVPGATQEPRRLEGELLAFDDGPAGAGQERIWVRPHYASGVPGLEQAALPPAVEVPLSELALIELDLHDAPVLPFGAWMTMGVISTVSHGWFLVISVPVWLLAGGLTVGAASSDGALTLPRSREPGEPLVMRWEPRRLRAYARWPQGMQPVAGTVTLPRPTAPAAPAPEVR